MLKSLRRTIMARLPCGERSAPSDRLDVLCLRACGDSVLHTDAVAIQTPRLPTKRCRSDSSLVHCPPHRVFIEYLHTETASEYPWDKRGEFFVLINGSRFPSKGNIHMSKDEQVSSWGGVAWRSCLQICCSGHHLDLLVFISSLCALNSPFLCVYRGRSILIS